jgi:hypothetical protein
MTLLATPAQAHRAMRIFGENSLPAHLYLNHLPIIGTILSVLALVLAFLWKNDAARRIALILLLVSTVSAYFVFNAGMGAYADGRRLADDAGWDMIDVHMARAEKGIYVLYLNALVTAVALYAETRRRRWATPATIAAGVLGLVAFAGSVWIADAGGKIRHSELRTEEAKAK